MSEGIPEQETQLVRMRRPRRRRAGILRRWGVELVIAGTLLLAVLVLLNPFGLLAPSPDEVSDLAALSGSSRLLFWLAHSSDARLIGLILFVVGLVAGVWRLRWRVLAHDGWYRRTCPHCGQEGTLKRRRRSWWHRVVGWFDVPARPYICQACHWRGTRIDETRIRY